MNDKITPAAMAERVLEVIHDDIWDDLDAGRNFKRLYANYIVEQFRRPNGQADLWRSYGFQVNIGPALDADTRTIAVLWPEPEVAQ